MKRTQKAHRINGRRGNREQNTSELIPLITFSYLFDHWHFFIHLFYFSQVTNPCSCVLSSLSISDKPRLRTVTFMCSSPDLSYRETRLPCTSAPCGAFRAAGPTSIPLNLLNCEKLFLYCLPLIQTICWTDFKFICYSQNRHYECLESKFST